MLYPLSYWGGACAKPCTEVVEQTRAQVSRSRGERPDQAAAVCQRGGSRVTLQRPPEALDPQGTGSGLGRALRLAGRRSRGSAGGLEEGSSKAASSVRRSRTSVASARPSPFRRSVRSVPEVTSSWMPLQMAGTRRPRRARLSASSRRIGQPPVASMSWLRASVSAKGARSAVVVRRVPRPAAGC